MMRHPFGEVVCAGQRCTLHPHRQQAPKEPAGIRIGYRQVDDKTPPRVDKAAEGQAVLQGPKAIAKDWRKLQEICAVERGLLHMRLVPSPVVHAEMEKADDLFVSDVTKQALSIVPINQKIGELAQGLVVLPERD